MMMPHCYSIRRICPVAILLLIVGWGAPSFVAAQPNDPTEPAVAASPDVGDPDRAVNPESDAAPPGQSDLDEAMRLRVTANSMTDLERVIELGESAIQKGLEEDTGLFARQMVAAALLQHASQLSQDILSGENRTSAVAYLRRIALKHLEKATEYDANLGEPYMLIARLEMMQGGDVARARDAAEKAVQRFANPDQRLELANALVLRATLQEDKTLALADFSKALELNPQNMQALRARGILYAQQEQLEKALADFTELLKVDSDNLLTLQDVARILEQKEDHTEALKYINRALELDPNSPQTRLLRAQIRLTQKEIDLALEDLDHVIAAASNDGKAMLLLSKARICLQQETPDVTPEAMRRYHKLATVDLSEALRLRPGDEETLILRGLAYASLEQFGPAIADIRALVELHPDKTEYQLQLAAYLTRDQRPRKAVEVYDQVLAKDENSDRARLGRADALLSIGEHAQAVEEYNKLLAREPQEMLDSILNNLAWVLATSPQDDVRDGKRSVELAKRACEITSYEQPHILSTLAAGYAELQDFEQALHWSQKAVELGKDHRDIEQLKSELDSYRQKKPWRERELVQEKEAQNRLENDTNAELEAIDLVPKTKEE